jgi:hypothetical protein
MSNKQLIYLLLGGVLLAWLATPVVIYALHDGMQERGQFGDLFGSVNSLFTGLAFAGMFYTVHLQAKQLRIQHLELKIQRQELRLQRQEMVASRKELANQVRMQRALIRATVAQVNVAAVNAQIEAQKMKSEMVAADGRTDHWRYIEAAGEALVELANKLESEIPGAG